MAPFPSLTYTHMHTQTHYIQLNFVGIVVITKRPLNLTMLKVDDS